MKNKENQYSRTALILGDDAIEKLRKSHIAIFGIGGVGGYAVEALARIGVGKLDLIDHDTVAISNLNRQIIATHSTLDQPKVVAMKKRIEDINPDTTVHTYQCFYLPEEKEKFDFKQYDYIIDAIDTVTAKLDLIETAISSSTPIICAMGCGNRIDPTQVKILDIYKTSGDPLAKVMRRELKKRGIKKLTVVTSTELPIPTKEIETSIEMGKRRSIPGSSAFVPAAAGLALAYYVTKEIIAKE